MTTAGYASTVYNFSGTINSASGDLADFNGGTISGTVTIDQVMEIGVGSTSSRAYSVDLGSISFSLVSNALSLDLLFMPGESDSIDVETQWSELEQGLNVTASQFFGFNASLNLFGGPGFLGSSEFPGTINWGDFQSGSGSIFLAMVATGGSGGPQGTGITFTVDSVNAIPEPATTALLGGALLALGLARRLQSR